MKVIATQRQDIEVELCDNTVADIVKSGVNIDELLQGIKVSFMNQQNLRPGYYLSDGYWHNDEELGYGSHSWTSTDRIRKATAAEISFMESFDELDRSYLALRIIGR